MTKVDGYNNDISPQVKSIIDDWERRLVNEYISCDIDGVSPNHYWIVKNMMGLLMEEMLGKWNNSKLEISEAMSKMLELDMLIMERDMMDMWKKLAVGVDSLGDGDSKNVSIALEMNFDPVPTILVVSTVPVTISDIFKGGQECHASVGKAIASMEKANPFVGKIDDTVEKVVILHLKHSLPLSDEELCGPSLMAEETNTHNTQDLIVTTSGANS